MLKKSIYLLTCLTLINSHIAFAFQPKEVTSYFNGPTVSSVEETSAEVSLSQEVFQGLTDEEKQAIYFQYYETRQVCIMIYPTPENCLPKKTEVGKSDVVISSLKPNTSYTVVYKRDNTIRCITAPCPENGFESLPAYFTTKGKVATNTQITQNLHIGSRGDQAILLQTILIQEGYLKYRVTGYFGVMTLQAVKQFQRDHAIIPTGFVGVLTRAALSGLIITSSVATLGEIFEGTITAYSTACFSDAVCSISIDGKKIVTTIGRSQEILGKVLGISDFGEIENKIGVHAKVYAKKTTDGYTLYGNSNFYIKIGSQEKLPKGNTL